MEDFIVEFENNSGMRVVVEDDGEVAYAYLFVDETPSGLVWLYNRAQAPSLGPEWDLMLAEASEKPPLNAKENIKEAEFPLPNPENISAVCNSNTGSAAIYIYERLHAILAKGQYPGKCVLAKVDSRLALVFQSPTQSE